MEMLLQALMCVNFMLYCVNFCKFLYFTPPDAIANILIKNAQRKCQKVI